MEPANFYSFTLSSVRTKLRNWPKGMDSKLGKFSVKPAELELMEMIPLVKTILGEFFDNKKIFLAEFF